MISLNLLTPKEVRVAVKSGQTVEDFLSVYGCTEGELRARFDQIFKTPKTAANVWSELKRNGKVKHKKSSEPAEEDPSSAFDKKIAGLKCRESELSSNIMELETGWYEDKRNRAECLRLLRGLEKELESIRESIAAQIDHFKRIVADSDQYTDCMNDKAAKLRGLREELNAVREDISRLSMMTIGLTLSGELLFLSFEDDEIWPVDESGSDEIFDVALKNELCGELKLNEIRGLARLLAIVRNAPMVKTELIFDNSQAELAYYQLESELRTE